ncbi:Crp/Fnr family transcriptional regulator [Fodinibius sp. Rm-B-1B1-1]|uniref:Crp/Fnr family transcriptional regulator n=1 Tax=Fodinibius alkaliphilus TaxID=3140241 RepID=UPI00315A340A
MFEQLYQSIHENVTLTDEEWKFCKNSFRPKRMLKRQFLLQEGDVCRQIAFIEKGALYSFSMDEKGTRHVMQFGFEGWWIADLHSFFTETPSTLNIEVLEDAELLLIDHKNHNKLLKEIPAYEKYQRIIMQNAYVALQQRVENALGRTAEERYCRLIERSPQFMNRVPLNLVASYLGMSPETLSRIRSNYSG